MKISRILSLLMIVVLLSTQLSCTPMAVRDLNATNEARVAATPNARPERTLTNFTKALQCMDDLFVRYNITNLLIGAQDVASSIVPLKQTIDIEVR